MLGCFASLWRQILLSCYKGKGSKKTMCPVRGRMHEVSMPFEKSCADTDEKGALYQAIALDAGVLAPGAALWPTPKLVLGGSRLSGRV